jgi:hypothetical protein
VYTKPEGLKIPPGNCPIGRESELSRRLKVVVVQEPGMESEKPDICLDGEKKEILTDRFPADAPAVAS